MLSSNLATLGSEPDRSFRQAARYKFIAPIIVVAGMLLVVLPK